MRNLRIVRSTKIDDIIEQMPQGGAHFTNGTYAYSADLILPTTVAGFDYVNSLRRLPMVLAVNSDVSMQALGKKDFEPQVERANKVAVPLAKNFPDSEVVVVFYDEQTPFSLYQSLAQCGVTATLHKWGYGTEPNAPKIEGAEFFESVYAFPLPYDTKPVCYNDTDLPDKPQRVTVVDLRDKINQTTDNSIISQAKRFASDHKYTLFAAGAAVVAISAFVAFSNHTTDETDETDFMNYP